jgi:hypothetical protein
MRVIRGVVFPSTTFTPAFCASTFSRLSTYNVNKMIGVLGKSFRSSDAAVKPFITGIDKSRVITSGLSSLATSRASWPFAASAQVLKPSDKKAFASILRIAALSSTTRTVFPTPGFRGSTSISTATRSRRVGLPRIVRLRSHPSIARTAALPQSGVCCTNPDILFLIVRTILARYSPSETAPRGL